jgi:phosphoserine phosphatase
MAMASRSAFFPSSPKEHPMAEPDPLPGWNDTPAKKAILDFIAKVTDERRPEFVPPARRIAVFDNDGTLWTERPVPTQAYFAQDRLEAYAEAHPDVRNAQPFKAFLEKDLKTIAGFSKRQIMEPGMTVSSGMTESDFRRTVREWIETADHPGFKRPYSECVYQPQLELLRLLRAKGFKTYIVSGGGADFLRVFSEDFYGIPPEQVIGSRLKTKVELEGGKPRLLRMPELDSFNDRDEKVVNIGKYVGAHPLLAFGNSDGDLRMLEYAGAEKQSCLSLLLHHDDAEREFAYDKEFKISPLQEGLRAAKAEGILVVSMKDDWKTVFPEARKAEEDGGW